MKEISDANNLVNAYYKSAKSVFWKESVQRYETDLLSNVSKTQKAIENGTYTPKEMIVFHLSERGRTRSIKSQHISDRVVQRSLVDNVLLARLRNKLIYDNGASLEGKGLDFARQRFENHLRKAYKEFDGEGYVLHLDFSKCFDNIVHEKILGMFNEVLDENEARFVARMFEEFEIDVSYMSDDEYANCMDVIFNAVEYDSIDNSLKTREKFMRKSVGIGNQISQIAGVYYPNRIDNYCKIIRGIKYYGRYMDDTYVIMKDKDELLDVYEHIKIICKELGIFINEKKTVITKLSDTHTFLKINYRMVNGRLLRKVHSSTFARERRRLTKLKHLLDNKRMTFADVVQCFKSWIGTYKKYDSGTKLYKLKKLFYKIFSKEIQDEFRNTNCRLKI